MICNHYYGKLCVFYICIINYTKNTMILCHFIQIFYAKPSARMPKFVQKLQFCQNYTIWLRKKKKKKVDFRGSGRGGFEHLWQLLGSNSHNLLLEWTFFSQNMGMRTKFFREYLYIFLTKCRHESSNCCVKKRKKGIILTFLAHNIV